MALSDKQNNIILNNLSSVRRIEDRFLKDVEGSLRTLDRQIAQFFTENNNIGLVDAAISRSNIERILLDSGYYQTTGRMLDEGYQAILNESVKTYRDLYGERFRFSDESLQRINAIKSLDFQEFNQLGSRAAKELNRILIETQLGNVSLSQALKTVAEDVIDKLGAHTQTWITTGTSSVYRTANTALATDNGITEFIYYGPIDSITRPFCRQHIGQTKTLEEWDKLDNGQINPVSRFLGGFRCRHTLVGIR